MKKCKICNIEKPFDEFYTHSKTKDGYLHKCKECSKLQASNIYNSLKNNSEFIEKERDRGRKKYRKYNYKSKASSDKKFEYYYSYKLKYPEKYKAHAKCQRLNKNSEIEYHHWSYNEIHYLDYIQLSTKDHMKAHRFMIYDQERMMYRRLDGILLDTRELHESYIRNMIDTQND